MAVTLPVEPAVLIWARKTAGYSTEAVSQKMRLPKERIESWEAGSEWLKKLHFPLAVDAESGREAPFHVSLLNNN